MKYSSNELLDDIDIQLLKHLGQDSNIATKDLAAKVNLSPSPVFERLKRLEASGFIKKYIAVLDAEKLSYGLMIFCNIKLKQHDKAIGSDFVKDVMQLKEVVECYNISGDYDFLLKVYARDMKHYQDFVFNKLGSVKSIGSTHSTFVMCENKNTHNINL
ncbi:Lrp/AsnC family transcriptional regulator [Mucilaginibacter achroorhodeus]|uniref:Lrp/AsnC family transcriptional regulator n=1 Tax=Mucilaginibacter achroorhodeus TaxID=2599294 RepID=A0A563U4H9_9SPHI|nr:Lrp/AsnC family transcriptional regulator [Mucilaginibacter achroorhodeus]TWR26225.1 Lrp/AsnC family transcriptional regulator [Mucilaginibacter achroorhodeus]